MVEAGVELICGCMFSGKTTRLLQRVAELQAAGLRVSSFKHALDDRYSATAIVSHAGASLPAIPIRTPGELFNYVEASDVLVVDEIHFFGADFLATCHRLIQQGRYVIAAGLDRDMWGDEFPHVRALMSMAHTLVMQGVCAVCGLPANRTHRKVPLLNNDLVGGPDEFEARCEEHFRPPTAPKPEHIMGLA
ncbi:MAG: Thymidine kinase [Phycisphaerae bacterium]|nr:Thymidine kinase [Phycisphaerae bacterium]